MQNPYQTLGVNKDASSDEIKRAYRKLASQHHPDKGGDKVKFQEIQAAYDTLSDPNKRAAFENPFQGFGMGGGFRPDAPFDFETIFNVFGTRFQNTNAQRRQQARMSLWITLRDSVEGGHRTISVGTYSGTHAVNIDIPIGINDGDSVQYTNIGIGNLELLITFRVHPDPKWQRQDLNLITEHAVSIWDLILGGETVIRDISGNMLSLTVQPNTQPGTTVRLRGRGIVPKSGVTGDILVRLQGRIPESITPELLELIKQNQTK